MIKQIFWACMNALNHIIPKSQTIILLYSGIEYKDNIKAVGDYLFSHGYNHKYHIVFGEYQRKTKTIYVNEQKRHVFSKLSSAIVFLFAGKILYAFNTLPIMPTKKQEAFQMWHGMPLKSIFNHGKKDNIIKYDYFSHILATSPLFAHVIADCVPCSIDKVFINGQPKTDSFYTMQESRSKMIFWAPTFRKAKYWNQTDVAIDSIIPLIPDNEIDCLNEYLNRVNIQMIIKLHPMESCDDDLELRFSNLSVYSHNSFSKKGLELYNCLSNATALITDYSSTYIDYLLLNRPIAFVVNNIDEYSNNRGFIFDNPLEYMPGKLLTNISDLYEFISEVSSGNDLFEKERTRINSLFNDYEKTASNTERLLEFMGIRK